MTPCDGALARTLLGTSTEADREHAAGCDRCRALFTDPRSERNAGEVEVVLRAVANDRRWTPPARVRLWLLTVAFAAPVTLILWAGAAPGLSVAGLVLAGVAAAPLVLTPIHRPPVPRWVYGVALLAPLLTWWPWTTPDPGDVMRVIRDSGPCLARGVAVAAFVLAVARAVDYRMRPSAVWFAGAALWGGLAGAAAMEAYCPAADSLHRMIGHGASVWVAAAAAWGLAGLRNHR